MSEDQDIRWIQRYNSFHKACGRILEITESDKKFSQLSELEMEGLVQRFEYTFELAWKVLQDFLRYKGYEGISGPNPVLQKAFEDGLLTNHDAWRRMAKARNTTSHTYNEGDALFIVENIYKEYSLLLKGLDIRLYTEKLNAEKGNLFT
ncbi:MAG: HI0074 family nucleotidyltransferase substrate-binding subunit [Bacteroidaceae bacterium]